MARTDRKKYNTLISNTLLFAISNFSSKLLSVIVQPYLSYALGDTAVMGVTKLASQCANLLIPLVSLGMSFAVIRFGLDKGVSKTQVFTNGFVSILAGFLILLLCSPLLRFLPGVNGYLMLLCAYMLVSCLRTLCTQFVRSRMLNRLVAIDGILCTFGTLMFYILFLNILKLGAAGYLLAIICGDGLSTIFVFTVAGLRRYLNFRRFSRRLLKDMLRYSLPMIPAQTSFWIINASDLFFVSAMCAGVGGLSGESWAGLLSTGYFMPTLVNTVGQIFCCAAGVIWLCKPLMHIFKENFFDAWQFVPLLTIAAAFTCLNLFLNSVYMVYKRSTLSLLTMLAGAISNLFMNWVFIRVWGPVGATAASMLSLFLVFLLRVRSTHSLLYITIGVKRVALTLVLLVAEAAWLLLSLPGGSAVVFGLMAAVIAVNFTCVWGMAMLLLQRFAPRLAARLPRPRI